MIEWEVSDDLFFEVNKNDVLLVSRLDAGADVTIYEEEIDALIETLGRIKAHFEERQAERAKGLN